MSKSAYKPDSSFTKQGGSGVSWKYQDEGKDAVFFGIFGGMDSDVGENHSNLYHFNRFKDDRFEESSFIGPCDIWGSSLLDVRFEHLERGDQVVVVYLGTEKSEKRKGKDYHNFDVYIRKPKTQTATSSEVAGEEQARADLSDLDFDLNGDNEEK